MKKNLFSRVSFLNHKPLRSFLLSLVFLLVGVQGFGQYTYTFGSSQFSSNNQTVALGTVSWTLSNDGGFYGYDATKGQQIGSAGNPASLMTLSTSGITGTITTVKITTSGAASVVSTVGVKVGSSSFTPTSSSITATSTEYTFTGSSSGSIVITWNNSSAKALYIKKLDVTYSAATNYTVTFNGNGSTAGTMANQTASTATNLTNNAFTKTSSTYAFSGWASSVANATTGTVAYANQASYPFTSNVTLYAIWGFTISYNVNSGAGSIADLLGYYNGATSTGTATLSNGAGFTRAGYTFGGWKTSASGTSADYAASSTYTHSGTSAAVTLYAHWIPNNNTITFNANGGTGTMANQTIATAATANLTTNTFTRAGYTFGGWATTAAATTAAYGDGASYTMGTSNVTLYAVWTTLAPYITTSGTLSALSTTYGTASSNTTFTVSAGNLTNNLIITPPSGFEVSTSAATGFTTSLDLGSANITNATVYVRLAATTAFGTYSGTIGLASGSTTTTIATASSTVAKKTLTITGLSGVNKEYDRTTTASVSGTPAYNGLANGETFSVTGTVTWAFADVNIGTAKPLTQTGTYNVPSTNYTVTQPTLTANITAKALTVTGATAQNKAYNGNTTATITGATLVGVISGDVVTVSGGGTFASANAGTGIIVTPALVLSGTNSGNYTIVQPTGLTADITPIAPTFTTSAISFNTGGTYALPSTNIASNSGGAFSYILGTASPAGSITITGTTLNGIAAGTATLTVNQAASGNYSAGSTTVPVSVTTVSAATDYFRSNVATGSWAAAGSWQSSSTGGSSDSEWITATQAPTSSAKTITIRNGHDITIDTNVTIDQVVIANGGTLETTNAFTINDGSADDIIIQNGGTLNYNSTTRPTFSGSSTISAESNGRILLSSGSAATLVNDNYVYKNSSILEWAQTGAFSSSGVTYFPNVDDNTIPVFRISSAVGGTVGAGTATVINGVLEVTGSVTFAGASAKTFRNGIRGSGTVTQSTAYKFIINGTTAELGGGTLTLNSGTGGGLNIEAGTLATLTSNKTINTGLITNNGSLDFGTYSIGGSAGFTQAATATIITSNTSGVPGSVAVSGTKTFSANGANYTFDAVTTTPFITGGSTSFSTLNINAPVNNNLTSTSTTVTTALNINNGGTFVASNNLNLSNTNGALNVAAGGTYDSGGENIVTSSGGTPTINIDGTFITRDADGFTGTSTSIPSITPTLGNNSTIVYGLSGDQAVTNFAYRNLTFSGSGIKTTGTISSIIGNVTINNGVTVDSGTRTFGGSGTNLIMLGTSIFKTGGSSTKPDIGGDYTLANTSTIEFGGASATIIRTAPSYGNINITGTTAGVALSGDTTSLTLQNGSAFTVKNGGIFNVRNVNGLSGSATTAINNTNSPTVALDSGSIVNYNGAAAQTVTTSPSYSNLIVSGSNVKTANAALTVNDKLDISAATLALKPSTANNLNLGGAMTIASGATFDNNGENQILNTNTASVVNNGTFITRDAQGFSGTNAAIPTITNITLGSGSTVQYALAGAQDVSARADYQNLLFTGNGTKTVSANITPIAGTVTINGVSTILDVAGNTFGSNTTNLIMTAGAFHLGGSGVKPDFGGTYSLASGTTIEFTGTSATQIRTTPTFANVVVSGTNVVAGTSSTDGLSFQSGGSFTVKNGAKFNVNNIDGFSGVSVSAIKNTNNPTITLEAGSTIDYTGADQVISNVFPYENLNVSSTGTKSPAASLTVNNLVKVSAGTLKMLKTTDTVDAGVLYAHKGINNTGGTVIFENNAQLIQDADAVNSGNIQSQRDVVDMNNVTGQIDYVYWSSPVSGQVIKGTTGFSPNTSATGYLQYTESTDKFAVTSDVNFQIGKGYAIRAETGTNGYNKTYNFTGVPNNGTLSSFENLKYTNSTHGYNLVGNPYPSNIDFDALVALNSTKIYTSAWFWTNNSYTAAQTGSSYSGNNYAIYNGTGGSPATSNPDNPNNVSVTPNGTIKVGQGFIVQVKSTGKDLPLSFNNSIRVTDKAGFFQKTNAAKNRFWLEMTSPNNLVNTILIGYIPGATNDYESDFDGELFVVGSDSFYSILGAKKLAIQGRAYNFSLDDVVPLGNVYSTTGNYTIKIKNPEGMFDNNQTVYLRDKLLNKYIDLSHLESYTFAGTKGTDNTRFEIVYKENTTLGVNDNSKSDFIVYRNGVDYVIQSSKPLGKIEVYDVSGRMIISKQTTDKILKLDSSAMVNGMYIVKAENSGDVRTKKIIK